MINPSTVQDHLNAVVTQADTPSRRELPAPVYTPGQREQGTLVQTDMAVGDPAIVNAEGNR